MEIVLKKTKDGYLGYLPCENILFEGDNPTVVFMEIQKRSEELNEKKSLNFKRDFKTYKLLRSEIAQEFFSFSGKTIIFLMAFSLLSLFVLFPIIQKGLVYTASMIKTEARQVVSKTTNSIINADDATMLRRRERMKRLYIKVAPFYEDFTKVFKEVHCKSGNE